MFNTNQSRSWSEMFDSSKFSFPDTGDTWLERIITNGLYYIINYGIINGTFLLMGFIGGKVILLLLLGFLFTISHMSLRQRSLKSRLTKMINHND